MKLNHGAKLDSKYQHPLFGGDGRRHVDTLRKRTYSASIHAEIFEWGSETAQTLVNNDYMKAYSLDYVSGDV